MAIVILPKDIYGTPNYKPLVNNSVVGTEFQENIVNDFINFNTIVHNHKADFFSYSTENGSKSLVQVVGPVNLGIAIITLGYAYVEAYYYTERIVITKKNDARFENIIDVFYGKNNADESNIKALVTTTKKTGKAISIVNSDVGFMPQDIVFNNTISNIHTFNPNTTGLIIEQTKIIGSYFPFDEKTATSSLANRTNLSITNLIETTDTFEFDIQILAGYKKISMIEQNGILTSSGGTTNAQANFTGTFEFLEPKQIDLTFFGNKRVIELSQVNRTFGEIPTNYKLDSNELFQFDTKVANETIGNNASKLIIEKWKNGKETIGLNVQFGEYYDENENLILSVQENDKRMYFQEGDLIIPYKPNTNNLNKGEPYAINLDGTPKVFRITGIKHSQTGKAMQELTCIEET